MKKKETEITPKIGDVWTRGKNVCFIHKHRLFTGVIMRVWANGNNYEILDKGFKYDENKRAIRPMKHGYNNWKLLFRDGKPFKEKR